MGIQTTLLVVIITLLSVTLAVLIVGIVVFFRRLDRTTREIAEMVKTVQEQVIPLAGDVRRTIVGIDELAGSIRTQVGRVESFVGLVERIIEYRTIAGVAGKAVATSRITATSVLEGLRYGLKILRSAKKEPKEESSDE